MKKPAALLLFLALTFLVTTLYAEGDDLFVETYTTPSLVIYSPQENEGIMDGNVLAVDIAGAWIASIDVFILWDDQVMKLTCEGGHFTKHILLPPISTPIMLLARGQTKMDSAGETHTIELTRLLVTPREQLIDDMIALAFADYKDANKNFLRANKSGDPGIAKNFLMRLFDAYKLSYCMAEYPDVELTMPPMDASKNCKPYRYGVQWAQKEPADGNCFIQVDEFRHDPDLGTAENREHALKLLQKVQKGDLLQLAGKCEDFNSVHSLLFTQDYDVVADQLCWTDCNMKGKRIHGARYGWVQFDTKRSTTWMLDTVCRNLCGATLYRLRDDLIKK